MMLKIVLFGLPSLVLDENPVTGFMSKKAFLLFCYLVLEKDRSHSREILAFLFWGNKSDLRARANLRQALQNIRQLLPGYFVVTNTTAAFDVTQPYQLDVETFQTLLAKPDLDPVQMEDAVNLYQGELLQGGHVDEAPELEEWLNRKREDCQRLFIATHEKLVQYYLRQGEWMQAIMLARRVLEIEPWREASHQQLMRLLARQGDYNAALTQYKVCCQVLEAELGIEPAPETVALYEHIQRARTAHRPPDLPTASGTFIGRQAELNRLSNLLHDPDCCLITLLGPGGIGKTRLAQALADQHWREFIDGVCYVSLGSVTQADFMVTAIADAARIQFSGAAPPHEQLIAALAEQELLLILDGFEHLMEGNSLVADILRGAPQVNILVTSREKLALQDEWVFVVEGLSTPPEEQLSITELERYDAVACLVQRAIQQQNDFTLRGQGDAVSRLCRLLGGSPLGIELAAVLLPVLSCTQIVDEVGRNPDVLTATRHNMPARHRSLRVVFDQSWRLLSADEQQVFSCLSVFRGGFMLEAAQQVAGADLAILSQLVAKSLLQVATGEEGMPPRYDIHEMLRQYAQEMLDGEPELRRQVQAAHSTYYAELVQKQGNWWLSEESQDALATISRDLDNMRMAWQRSVINRDVTAIAQMMLALQKFYDICGWYQEMSDMYAPALEGLQSPETPEEQLIWGQLSAIHAWDQLYLARLGDAHQLAQQAVDILRKHEPGKPLAHALNTLGVMYLNEGDYATAKEILQESLTIYSKQGYRRECFAVLGNLGTACTCAGDYESAQKFLEDGLALCSQEGIQHGVAHFLDNLGFLHCTLGDLVTARHYFEQALPVCDVGLPHLKGCILIELSEVGVRQGKFEQALADCQAGIEILRQVKDQQTQALGLLWHGLAHYGLGNRKAAYSHVKEGLEVAIKVNNTPVVLTLLLGGAALLLEDSYQKKGIDILTMVTRHPATEQKDRAYAQELLAQHGITLPDEVVFQKDSSLATSASELLDVLKVIDSTDTTQ